MSKRPASQAFDEDKHLIAELRTQIARLQKDVDFLNTEYQLARKHSQRYLVILMDLEDKEMLAGDELVRCEACDEMWRTSGLGVDGNPNFCTECHELWCTDCVPTGGCGCADKKG